MQRIQAVWKVEWGPVVLTGVEGDRGWTGDVANCGVVLPGAARGVKAHDVSQPLTSSMRVFIQT